MLDDLERLQEEAAAVQDDGLRYREGGFTAPAAMFQGREHVPSYSPKLDRAINQYTTAIDELNDRDGPDEELYEQLVWAFPDPMTTYRVDEPVLALERDARDRMRIYSTFDRFLERFSDSFETAENPDELRETLQQSAEAEGNAFTTYFDIWDERAAGWEDVLWTWYAANPEIRAYVADTEELYNEAREAAAIIEDEAQRLLDRSNHFE